MLVGGLLTLGVVVPLAIGLAAGSQDIPRVDDWVYRRVAIDLASRGVLSLHSVTTMLIGQIILVQPFLKFLGLQPVAFSAFGVVAATAAVLASYVLARQFLSARRSALTTASLLIFPGYMAYATSFMTDVPTLALAMACLAFGVVAVRRRPVRTKWLVASVAVGCLAFSIREFAIAAPVAVLLAAICAQPRRATTWSLVVGVACWCGLLVLLKSALPGQDLGSPAGYVASGLDLSQLVEAIACVSLPLLPVLVFAFVRGRELWRQRDMAVGLELGLVLVAYQLFEWYQTGALPLVLLPSLATQRGVPGPTMLFGTRPLLFGDAAWLLICVLALISSVLALAVSAGIVGWLIRRHKNSRRGILSALGSPPGVLVLFVCLFGGGLAAYGFHWAVYDRYYWPLIPAAATLVMYVTSDRVSRRSAQSTATRFPVIAPVVAAFLAVSLISAIFMLNSFAFDSARWRAGEALAKLGVAPDELDAGYEWVGAHAPTLADSVKPVPALTFYEGYFSGYQACGVVSSSPWADPGYELVGTESYSLDLVGGPTETLYLYRATSKDCAAS